MQSTSSASVSSASALGSQISESVPVSQNKPKNNLTAAQSVAILSKLDKYLKADMTKKLMGKASLDYLQEQLLVDDELAHKRLYIKKHLVALVPAIMVFPFVDVLHDALKKSLAAIGKGYKRVNLTYSINEEERAFSEKVFYGYPDRVGYYEGKSGHVLVIQRWVPEALDSARGEYLNHPEMVTKEDLDPRCQEKYNSQFYRDHNLPRFDEKRKECQSFIWVHPSRTKQLENCTMEQLEFMVDLYHTQDPWIQKNRKRALILNKEQVDLFNALPERLKKNLKVQYPLVTTPVERTVHTMSSFLKFHRVKILCALAFAASVYSYCKWLHKPLYNWLVPTGRH